MRLERLDSTRREEQQVLHGLRLIRLRADAKQLQLELETSFINLPRDDFERKDSKSHCVTFLFRLYLISRVYFCSIQIYEGHQFVAERSGGFTYRIHCRYNQSSAI